jgi:Fe-S-cluster-containing hydrogenase component 2
MNTGFGAGATVSPPKDPALAGQRSSLSHLNRFEELKAILDQGRYFKVVCAAGNQDAEEVYRLSVVYTLAGAMGIDVSADVDVVRASMRGIDKAAESAPSLRITVEHRPFITVSVGLKGDPHVRKARIIEEACTACGDCYENCDDRAIEANPYRVLVSRCIGCGGCAEVCGSGAVEFYTRQVDCREVLPRCIEAGAENVELHARISDDEAVMRDWRIIAKIVPDQFISMCLDRCELSNSHLIKRVRQAREVAGDRLIIQADGAPMSGGTDDFNTTLQAVDCANVILKSGIDVKVLLSGGTNSKTGALAALCGLAVHGVSVGTFARNLVREEIDQPDFDSDPTVIRRAVVKARCLVNANIERIRAATVPERKT